ncbi:hypothetical protein H310_14442 [Aphanomyces invadans]|uniref:subtilisin n=1 Tax=Aphanomyces invadans TaxID=157072 RepID=A0A024TB70_9STRA|nr:hypothetical protein H310_14442 [Aphanomyces invadans]ETV90846.1 hypothetical protein H310_14442 [Aphanomyces invadans]|eukprot:XP_008880524.1 hypothetical protein H310_14442 [Aphanomyces invadans]
MVKLAVVAAIAATTVTAKIASSVHRLLEVADSVDVVVEFKDGNTRALRSAKLELNSIQERGPRIAHLRSLLVKTMESSQKEALEVLASQPEAFSVRTKQFHISNTLFLYGANRNVLDKLAKLDTVAVIRSPVAAHLPVSETDDVVVDLPVVLDNTTEATVQAIEWGVNRIGAPTVWASGNRGQGVVVGFLDTGVVATHEALKGNYRSTHGWFDPIHKSATPFDSTGHGTHVLGTAVGANGIGVAPDAQWIACRGCNTDACPEDAKTACAQFLLCPTDADGSNPKCELAPHVINNSWGDVTRSNSYQASVNAWRAAGIIPVFAIGNFGPNCGTVTSPGDFKNVIGVGAVGWDDKLTTASSRGASQDGTRKPDVTAPGLNVRSTWHVGNPAYKTISGTSTAAPHVTGTIALYLSKHKGATYDDVYSAITYMSVDTSGLTPERKNCGGLLDTGYPNNSYGWGRINAARALGVANNSPSNHS